MITTKEEMIAFVFRFTRYLSDSNQIVNPTRSLALITSSIRARREEEPLADPACANWMIWTIFNFLEVSRVRKWEDK